MNLLKILITYAVVNNFTLSLFLGLCPFLGVSGKIDTALRMGAANLFVLVVTSLATSALNAWVLPHAPYLGLISFIVVIASCVQFVEMVIKKTSPALFKALGIYLPLISTNCAMLGLALFQTSKTFDVWEGLAFAFGTGLGLTIALVLMAGIREENELANIPKVMRHVGMSFLIAGILSMGFMGFAGLASS